VANDKLFTRRGWIGAAIVLPAVLAASLSQPLVREGELADVMLDVAAWLILGAGIFLRLWATLYIGGRKSTSLIVDGPYALCRHPLYVGSFLIIVSLAVFLESPVVLASALTMAGVYRLFIVPSEEANVAAIFGDAYHRYCAVTPRFWFCLARLSRPGKIEVKVTEFLREFARAYGLIAVGAIAEIVAFCRSLPWWPKLLNLP